MTSILQTIDSAAKFQKLFDKGNPIASGAFGVVSKVVYRKTGLVVAAIKLTDLSKLDRSLHRYSHQEIEMMKKFRHRNVATLFASYCDGNQLVSILELCQCDLNELIKQRRNKQPLPTDQVLDYCSQMLHGLEYLHARGVIHRDLKPTVTID